MEVIEQTVREASRALQPGERVRTVCPSCNAHHEKSFSINRDAYAPQKIWFRCWRAACGIHGCVTDADGILLKAIHADDDEALEKIPVLDRVPRAIMGKLSHQLGLTVQQLEIQQLQYDPHTETMYYPLWNRKDSRSVQVGWQTRTENKTIRNVVTEPGAYTYSTPLGNPRHGPTVFVENLWSAYKLQGLGIRSVALLGHRVWLETASSTRQDTMPNWNAILLLDPDCWPTQVSAALRNLEARGWNAHAIHITEKPHRMKQSELQKLLP
jgi:hypothetical protein